MDAEIVAAESSQAISPVKWRSLTWNQLIFHENAILSEKFPLAVEVQAKSAEKAFEHFAALSQWESACEVIELVRSDDSSEAEWTPNHPKLAYVVSKDSVDLEVWLPPFTNCLFGNVVCGLSKEADTAKMYAFAKAFLTGYIRQETRLVQVLPEKALHIMDDATTWTRYIVSLCCPIPRFLGCSSVAVQRMTGSSDAAKK